MKRLTEKDEKYYRIAEPYISWTNGVQKVVKKLGQLEDIEEELGIDLITLFKVREGIYYKNALGTIRFINSIEPYNYDIDIYNECIYVEYFRQPLRGLCFNFKNYGKTWALTKEELEKKV